MNTYQKIVHKINNMDSSLETRIMRSYDSFLSNTSGDCAAIDVYVDHTYNIMRYCDGYDTDEYVLIQNFTFDTKYLIHKSIWDLFVDKSKIQADYGYVTIYVNSEFSQVDELFDNIQASALSVKLYDHHYNSILRLVLANIKDKNIRFNYSVHYSDNTLHIVCPEIAKLYGGKLTRNKFGIAFNLDDLDGDYSEIEYVISLIKLSGYEARVEHHYNPLKEDYRFLDFAVLNIK